MKVLACTYIWNQILGSMEIPKLSQSKRDDDTISGKPQVMVTVSQKISVSPLKHDSKYWLSSKTSLSYAIKDEEPHAICVSSCAGHFCWKQTVFCAATASNSMCSNTVGHHAAANVRRNSRAGLRRIHSARQRLHMRDCPAGYIYVHGPSAWTYSLTKVFSLLCLTFVFTARNTIVSLWQKFHLYSSLIFFVNFG